MGKQYEFLGRSKVACVPRTVLLRNKVDGEIRDSDRDTFERSCN